MLDEIKAQLPDFAKDLKLNLDRVLTTDPNSKLNITQIYAAALCVAYATKNKSLMNALIAENQLDDAQQQAAKASASIMAMNNIYYRFIHLTGDTEMQNLPANLRMNVLANPGIERIDFEINNLAVSIFNGCEYCVQAHTRVLNKAGFSKTTIQHIGRITAVINGVAQVLAIANP